MEKREDRKRVAKGLGGFGRWITVMRPTSDTILTGPSFIPRKEEGLRKKSIPAPDKPGVYEVSIIPKGKTDKDRIPVYIGKAGGVGIKQTLKDRSKQYAWDGSHKKEFYNTVLKEGGTIQMRFKTLDPKDVKTTETKHLQDLDYALNIMENGKKRPEDIQIGDKTLAYYLNTTKTTKDARPPIKPINPIPKKNSTAPAKSARTMQKARPPTKNNSESQSRTRRVNEYGAVLNKDGSLDKRVKANKMFKEDGTPDRRKKKDVIPMIAITPKPKPKTKTKATPIRSQMVNPAPRAIYTPQWGTYQGRNVRLTKSGLPDRRCRENRT